MIQKSKTMQTEPVAASEPVESADHKLMIEERRRQIREMVEAKGSVTVDELAEHFAISKVSIRSDLRALDTQGALVRSRGGALVIRDGEDLPINIKENLHRAQKVRIAEEAVKQIVDGETIILDSGSTTAEIAKLIRGMKFTSINVITNALNIAVLLANTPHVNLVMPGGVLRANSFCLSGPQAEHALDGLYADRLFLGVDSIDPEIGLMTPHLLEAQLNAQMIKISRKVIAVTDSSKLMRRNLSVIARMDQIDTLITDKAAPANLVDLFTATGVEVILV
ncbi:DeoR family transcriptional regulator of aga operon [Oxalobacteraceae bacterium GrIS 2.11]